MIVPGQGAHSSRMARHGPETSASFRIPDLDQTFVGANRDMGPSLNPRDRSDNVVLKLAKLCYSA